MRKILNVVGIISLAIGFALINQGLGLDIMIATALALIGVELVRNDK